MAMTADVERDCLAVNPFEGDFGEPGDRVLSNSVVTTRASGAGCHCCSGAISPGERARKMVAKFGGRVRQYRWCGECCAAMAGHAEDGGAAWEARYALRRSAAEKS